MYLEFGGGCIIWDDDPYMKMADLNADGSLNIIEILKC